MLGNAQGGFGSVLWMVIDKKTVKKLSKALIENQIKRAPPQNQGTLTQP